MDIITIYQGASGSGEELAEAVAQTSALSARLAGDLLPASRK